MTTDPTEPLYAWQVFEHGEWNLIAAVIPGVADAPVPLVTTRRKVCDLMQPLALAHRQATGLPVRLAHYDHPIITRIQDAP